METKNWKLSYGLPNKLFFENWDGSHNFLELSYGNWKLSYENWWTKRPLNCFTDFFSFSLSLFFLFLFFHFYSSVSLLTFSLHLHSEFLSTSIIDLHEPIRHRPKLTYIRPISPFSTHAPSPTRFIILLTNLWSPASFIHHTHWNFFFNQPLSTHTPSPTHASHALSSSLCVFIYVVVDSTLGLLERS